MSTNRKKIKNQQHIPTFAKAEPVNVFWAPLPNT